MNGYRCDQDIIQNLKDAGCDDATILAFMEDVHSGKQTGGAKLLESHRRSLLNALHTEQKRIDCLDYLLFTLQQRDR